MASRRIVLILAFAAGCSTHPLVDTCDYFRPGHLYPNKVAPYGGACIPQGVAIQGTSPSVPFGPLIPPPAPLPSSGPGISVPTYPTNPPGSVVPVPGANLPPPTFPSPPQR